MTSTCNVGGGSCGGFLPAVVTNSATKTGWTVGAGIETPVGGNWFARAEYRYADFGPSGFTIDRAALTDNFDVALRTHTVTFGIAYKFGGSGLLAN